MGIAKYGLQTANGQTPEKARLRVACAHDVPTVLGTATMETERESAQAAREPGEANHDRCGWGEGAIGPSLRLRVERGPHPGDPKVWRCA